MTPAPNRLRSPYVRLGVSAEWLAFLASLTKWMDGDTLGAGSGDTYHSYTPVCEGMRTAGARKTEFEQSPKQLVARSNFFVHPLPHSGHEGEKQIRRKITPNELPPASHKYDQCLT